MKHLLLTLLLLPSLTLAAECPPLVGKWNLLMQGDSDYFDAPAIARLEYREGGEFVNMKLVFAQRFIDDAVGEPVWPLIFTIEPGELPCSFRLLEAGVDPRTWAPASMLIMMKGKHRFTFVAHMGNLGNRTAGVGERTWLP